MTSAKESKANRSNATRSTGPKSASGKSRSRMNSLKHGLTAKQIVIGDEDPTEFQELRDTLEEEFAPLAGLEAQLVDRLALLLWRLRRVPRFEASIIEAHRAEIARTQAGNSRAEDARRAHLEKVSKRFLLKSHAPVVQGPEPPPQQEKMHASHMQDPLTSEIGMALMRDSQNSDMLGKLARHEAAAPAPSPAPTPPPPASPSANSDAPTSKP
jgi:hypothetical protein